MRGRKLSWLIGGIGLIACGVVGVVRGSVQAVGAADTALSILGDVLWAGAVLILTFGLTHEGSVVARKPLGLAASVPVALWPLTDTFVGQFAGPLDPERAETWLFWEYLSMVLPLMVGLVAAMQVVHARVVPAPWNRAPLWALGIQTATWILPQLIGAASPAAFTEMAGLIAALGILGFLATTLGLGIVAVVLSNRAGGGTVHVFQSSQPD